MALIQLLRGIDDKASVRHQSADRHAAVEQTTLAKPRIHTDVNVVEDLFLLSELRRVAHQIVHRAERLRRNVVESADLIAASACAAPADRRTPEIIPAKRYPHRGVLIVQSSFRTDRTRGGCVCRHAVEDRVAVVFDELFSRPRRCCGCGLSAYARRLNLLPLWSYCLVLRIGRDASV